MFPNKKTSYKNTSYKHLFYLYAMLQDPIQDFIHLPIADLPLSKSFKQICSKKGFRHLADIIDLGCRQAIGEHGLGNLHFEEFIRYLEDQHLLFLLKD